jgi:hypothetical protein
VASDDGVVLRFNYHSRDPEATSGPQVRYGLHLEYPMRAFHPAAD